MLKINTMKKQIFTLLIMLALVAVTGNVFAQSTPTAPYEGATHTYAVGGLHTGDTYTFGVSTTEGNYTTNGSNYTINGSNNGNVDGTGTATLSVTWNNGSAAFAQTGNYYVWISINDGTCTTYRALEVNPVPAVNYTVDFNVLAELAGDGSTTLAQLQSATGVDNLTSQCPAYEGADRLATNITDVLNDGSTYAYFSVNRTVSGGGNNSAWAFTPSSSTTGVTWQISLDGTASTWTSMSLAQQNIALGVNTVYVRAIVANGATAQNVQLNIGTSPLPADAGGLATDATTTDNVATLEVRPAPAVAPASFSGSF